METEVYNNFAAKEIEGRWYVIADSDQCDKYGLKIAVIPSHIRYPKAVAQSIAESLNKNIKIQLVDLV